MGRRSFKQDERGVWVSLAALMMVSIFIISTSIYYSRTIPKLEHDQERIHADTVKDALLDLQTQISQITKGESFTIMTPKASTVAGTTYRPSTRLETSIGSGSTLKIETFTTRRDFEDGQFISDNGLSENILISDNGRIMLDNAWYGNRFYTYTGRMPAPEVSSYSAMNVIKFTAEKTENIENAYMFGYVYATEFPSLKVTFTDGSYQYVNVIEDAFVDNNDADDQMNTNYGYDDELKVYHSPSNKYLRRSFLKFDLTRIDPTNNVQKAELVLATGNVYDNADDASGVDYLDVVQVTDDSWDEDLITWNNQPALGAIIDSQICDNDNSYETHYWNVTTYVQNQMAGDNVASMAIKLKDEVNNTSSTGAYFTSREYISSRIYIAQDVDGRPSSQIGNSGYARFTDLIAKTNWSEDFGWMRADNLHAQVYKDNTYFLVAVPQAAYNYPNPYTYYSYAHNAPRNVVWTDNSISQTDRAVMFYGRESTEVNEHWYTYTDVEPIYVIKYADGTHAGQPYHPGFKFYSDAYYYYDINDYGDGFLYINPIYSSQQWSAGIISSDGSSNPDYVWGENFYIPDSITVQGLEVPVRKDGNPGYELEVAIENSTWRKSFGISPDKITSNPDPYWYRFEMDQPVDLSGYYWIYLRVRGYTRYDSYIVPLDNADGGEFTANVSWDGGTSRAFWAEVPDDNDNLSAVPTADYVNVDMPFRLVLPDHRSPGAYTSRVIDPGKVVKWLSVEWENDTPAGTTVTVEARVGNMLHPEDPNVTDDKNYPWSEWRVVQKGQDLKDVFGYSVGDGEDNSVGAALQFRVILSTTDVSKTPNVWNVSVKYYDGVGTWRKPDTRRLVLTTHGDFAEENATMDNVDVVGGSVQVKSSGGGWKTDIAQPPYGPGDKNGQRLGDMNGKIYFWLTYGGENGTTTRAANYYAFYSYDPVADAWTALADAPFYSVYGIGSAAAITPTGENAFYIIKGYWSATTNFARYTDSGGWNNTLSTSIPWAPGVKTYSRNGATLVWDRNDRIYLFPGAGYADDFYDYYYYTISNDTWTYAGVTPEINGPGNAGTFIPGSALGEADNYLYVILGRYHYGDPFLGGSYNTKQYGSKNGASFYRYNLSSYTWELITKHELGADHPYGADDGSQLFWDGYDRVYHTPGSFEEYDDSEANCADQYEPDYHGYLMVYTLSGRQWYEAEKVPYDRLGAMDDGGSMEIVDGTLYILKGGNDLNLDGTRPGGGGGFSTDFWSYTPPIYYNYGEYTSTIDMGEQVTFTRAQLSKTEAAGNVLYTYLSFSNDGNSWTSEMLVDNGTLLDNYYRYMKYRLYFDVSNDNTVPVIFKELILDYTVGETIPTYNWSQSDWSGGETTPTVESGQWLPSYAKYYDGENVSGTVSVGDIALVSAGGLETWGNPFRVDQVLGGDNLNSSAKNISLRFRARQDENVYGVRVYVEGYAWADLAARFYDDSGGNPGSSISSENTVDITGKGWNTIQFDPPVQLVGNNVYHVVLRSVEETETENWWVQDDWSGGPGQLNWSDNTRYNENENAIPDSGDIISDNFTTFTPLPGVADHVVISEVSPYSTPGEFVELYNPTNAPINMDGWYLNVYQNDYTFTASDTIPAYGFFLISDTDPVSGVAADVFTNINITDSGASSYVELRSGGASGPVVDAVGWGTSSIYEGTLASYSPGNNDTLERKSSATHDSTKGNGYDTDNNADDFYERDPEDPQNSSSATEQPGTLETIIENAWFTSSVFDGTTDNARWNYIDWGSTTPAGTSVTVFARFDNSNPGTWSTGKPAGGSGTPSWTQMSSPQQFSTTARYGQYAVEFTSDGSATARFENVRLKFGIPLEGGTSGSWSQTDWSGGGGQATWSDSTRFDNSENIDWENSAGSLVLQLSGGGEENVGNLFVVDTTTATIPSENTDNKIAFRFTAQASKTVDAVRVYVDQYFGSPTMKLELQTNNGGLPSGTKVSSGASGTASVTGTGWVQATFSSPKPSLTAGNVYHIVLWDPPLNGGSLLNGVGQLLAGVDTGYVSPTTNSDENGNWNSIGNTDPTDLWNSETNAYGDDGSVADATNIGDLLATGAPYYASHSWGGFTFTGLGANDTVDGIEVYLNDAYWNSSAGTDSVHVTLYTNNGGSWAWTGSKDTGDINATAPGTSFTLGGSTDKWGLTNPIGNDFASGFKVMLMASASAKTDDFYIDYVGVKIYYTAATAPENVWTQTDWSAGALGTSPPSVVVLPNTADNYSTGENENVVTAGQIVLAKVGTSGTETDYEAATVVTTGTEVGGTSTNNLDLDDDTYYEVDSASGGGGENTNVLSNPSFETGTLGSNPTDWPETNFSGSAKSSDSGTEWSKFDSPDSGALSIPDGSFVGRAYPQHTIAEVNGIAGEQTSATFGTVTETNDPELAYWVEFDYGYNYTTTQVAWGGPCVEVEFTSSGSTYSLRYYNNARSDYSDPADNADTKYVIGSDLDADTWYERRESVETDISNKFGLSTFTITAIRAGVLMNKTGTAETRMEGVIDNLVLFKNTPGGNSLEIQHDSGQVTADQNYVDNVYVKLNFLSSVAATYTWDIYNWNTPGWETLYSSVSVGASEVTWENTLTTSPADYINDVGGDEKIRVRLTTNGEASAHRVREDFLQYQVNYSSSDNYADGGYLESDILDLGENKKWDNAVWDNLTPAGTSVVVKVRSSNTDTNPYDGGWGSWQQIENGVDFTIADRYLQYRVELSTTDPAATPEFYSISFYYSESLGATATATGPTGYDNQTSITLTYSYTGSPTSVELWYTTDGGTSWNPIDNDAPVDGSYAWTAPSDDNYGFLARAIGGGSTESAPTGGTQPEVGYLVVDTTSPSSPTLVTPDNDNYTNSTPVTVDWNDSTDVAGVDNYVVFVNGTENTTVTDNATTQASVDFEVGTHTWYVKAVDYAGNEGVSETRTITVDKTNPSVSSTTPANGATDVSISQSVIVVFNEVMDSSTTPNLTQLTGTDPGGWSFSGWSMTTVENDTGTWTHNDWTGGENISMRVSNYKDKSGNTGSLYDWSFTTASGATATATGPIGYDNDLDNIITYSYTGSPTSVELWYTTNGGSSWNVIDNDAPVDGSYAWTAPGEGTYGWYARAIGGGSVETVPTGGTSPEAENLIIDLTPPSVSSTTPADGANNVPPGQNVVVVFGEEMDTGQTPTITQTSGTDPGGWSFAGWSQTAYTNDTATWTHNDWLGSENIGMRVSNYKDLAGSTGSLYNWSFNTSSWIRIRVSTPQENMVPYGGAADNNSNLLVSTNSGSSWIEENQQPIFILDYSDASYEGNPYSVDNSLRIAQDNFAGENFLVTGGDKLMTKLAVYIKKTGSPPDLRYTVRDENGTTVVDNQLFLQAASVGTSYAWVENSNLSFNLIDAHRYAFYLSTAGDSSSNYYEIKAPDAETTGTAYESTTYDGTSSFATRTTNAGASWINETNRDVLFRMTASPPYLTGGYVQSSWYDSGDATTNWGSVTFTASKPSGTSVSVYVQVSDDSGVSWAENGGPYTVGDGSESVGLQGRYIRYRVYLNSTDPASTPTFNDISIDWSRSSLSKWVQVRVGSVLNENMSYDARTADNANVLYSPNGSSWSERNYQPIYVLDADTNADGSVDAYEGSPYDENAVYSIYQNDFGGVGFTVSGSISDKTKWVKGVSLYLRSIGSPGTLNYTLYDVTGDRTASSGSVGGVTSSWSWVSVSFDALLIKDRQYRLYLSNSGGDASNRYEWLAPARTATYSDSYDRATFDGVNTYGTTSTTGGSSWTDNTSYDPLFVFNYATGFTSGTLESSVYDAGTSANWTTLSLSATDSSWVTTKVRTGSDSDLYDGGWDNWTTVTGLIGETNRFIQYRLELTTADENTTPVVHDITLTYTESTSSVAAPDPDPTIRTWTQTTREDFFGSSPAKLAENIEIVPPGDVTLKAEDYWGNSFAASSGYTPGAAIDSPTKLFSIRFEPKETENLQRVRLLIQVNQDGEGIAPGDSPSEWDENEWIRVRLYPDDGTGKPNMSGAPLSIGSGHPDKEWSWEWYMPYPRVGKYMKYADNSDWGHSGIPMSPYYVLQAGNIYHIVVDANDNYKGFIGEQANEGDLILSTDNYFIPLALKMSQENWINNQPINSGRGVLFSADNGTSWTSSDEPSSFLYRREPVYILDVGDEENMCTQDGNPYYKSADEIYQANFVGERFTVLENYDRLDGAAGLTVGAVEFYTNRSGTPNEVHIGVLTETTILDEKTYWPPIDVSDFGMGWTRFTLNSPFKVWENDTYIAYAKSPSSEFNNYMAINSMKTAWAEKAGWVDAGFGGESATYVWSQDGVSWNPATHREIPFRLVTKFKSGDNYVSRVFDAGQVVDWKFIEWDATRQPGTSVKFYVRGGNISNLIGAWSGPYEDGRASLESLTNSRFFQYKIELLSNADQTLSPAVHEVRVGYRGGLGSIVIQPSYRQYQNQKWVYEGGAVILSQDSTSVMYSEPNNFVKVEAAGGTDLKVTVNYQILKSTQGLRGQVMPTAESITVSMPNDPVYTVRPDNGAPNRDKVEVVVVSSQAQAWSDYFQKLSTQINGEHGANASSVDTSGVDYGEAKLTISGKGSGDDIIYYELMTELLVRTTG